ncbi:MAG: glycosyltransferase family 4 protein [Planctomycetota bacterium]|jgi:glycosyltransferase involved in cell wall biosynthesis
MKKILHLLSQRPSLTGSGVTLDSFVRHARNAGWRSHASAGVPCEEPQPEVGGLPPDRIHPLLFGEVPLDFPVPGMSDIMPYTSTVFSRMSAAQIEAYSAAWRCHIAGLVETIEPDLIHSHHIWIMSSLVKEIAPEIPLVIQCHATGLRQMSLCPHLESEVREGCIKADGFVVLHRGHADQLAGTLRVPEEKIHVVGNGFREELFHARGRKERAGKDLLYVGKYSAAKGLPWLLDAVERLAGSLPDLRLHVAGAGAGTEADALAQRMKALSPLVKMHGMLTQPDLAKRMRASDLLILPSFYEGVPLVLAEALACGCRLVATELPGVMDRLAPRFGPALDLIDLPRMTGVDTPLEEDLPAFTDRIVDAISSALAKPPIIDPEKALPGALEPLTWGAVFKRVETVWLKLSGN